MDILHTISENYRLMLSDPAILIQTGGFVLLLVIIYMETGFIVGMFLPGGDYTLFTAGFLCGTQLLEVPFLVLFPSLAAAAFLGDITGYGKGKWLGPRLFTREKSRFFKPSYLEKTHTFYEKYGAAAFITGKFLPVIRAVIPLMAGASDYKKARFFTISMVGAVVWTGSLTLFGYVVGHVFPGLIQYKLWVMFGFILLASTPALSIYLRKKK